MDNFKNDIINRADDIINSTDYQIAHNHDMLLQLFDLSNPRNIEARKFDGLYRENLDGIEKYQEQLVVMGEIFQKLDNNIHTFILEAIERDKVFKENNSITNNNFIDLKEIIVLTLQNPHISKVSSIESISLLKEIYAPDTIKGKMNIITAGMDATPIITVIESIMENPKEIDGEELKKIKDTFEIIKNTSENNPSNNEKIAEIQKMINEIEENHNKNIEVKKSNIEDELEVGLKFAMLGS